MLGGANDGSTLIALSLPSEPIPPLALLASLAAIVTLGPFLLGTAVATTVVHGLVALEGSGGKDVVLIATAVAVLVVFTLSRWGLPTSLTLALVGGLVGAAVGARLPVAWATVGRVLALGLCAPLVSVAIGFLSSRAVRRVPRQVQTGLHGCAFAAQCVAYSANDAQKLVAIMAVGTSATSSHVTARPGTQILIGATFALGTLVNIRRTAHRVGHRMVQMRVADSISSEIASAIVVLSTSALGFPVSTTQAATAALIGSGLSLSSRRVRWLEAARIAAAWVVTLPASAALGALGALTTRGLR